MNIADLKSKGFVLIEYPHDLRRAVETTARLWKKFCALPMQTKLQIPYSNDSAGVGYQYQTGAGEKGDWKENFDVTKAGKDWLLDHAVKTKNLVVIDFVERAIGIVDTIKPLALDFARSVEEEYSLKGFAKEVEESVDAFFVRFIRYPGGREDGVETASAHTDQSGATFHLFESAPGFECLGKDKKWIRVPISKGETVAIGCMQLQYVSEGEIDAACHRVVAIDGGDRLSAVCFIQFKNWPKYDKKTHGRLQEKPPGFNYGMAHEQFKKLFK